MTNLQQSLSPAPQLSARKAQRRGRTRWSLAWMGGVALTAVWVGSAAAPQRTPETSAHRVAAQQPSRFAYAYEAPRSSGLEEIHRRVKTAQLWKSVPELSQLDGRFDLPRTLTFTMRECGEFGALYLPRPAEVVLCYETLDTLYQRGTQRATALGREPEYAVSYLRANVRFMVLHETGHAFIHLLDLPVTGRQEDAVDQLAAMLMLHYAGERETPDATIANLRMAADGMLAKSTGAYNLRAYADEHALGEQRYFNLQCLIYGTDPARFSGMVAARDLTAARAQTCPGETRRIERAWRRLLRPHLRQGDAPALEQPIDRPVRQH